MIWSIHEMIEVRGRDGRYALLSGPRVMVSGTYAVIAAPCQRLHAPRQWRFIR